MSNSMHTHHVEGSKILVGDEVSRAVVRARHALEQAYDLYARRQWEAALAKVMEADDASHNAAVSMRAERLITLGEYDEARRMLKGLIVMRD